MSIYSDLRGSDAYHALLETSATLGGNPWQVQGAGGNTSLKQDGAMWIKASGTWLADARTRDIMVPVDAHAMARAVANREPRSEDVPSFMVEAENLSGLRASIETSVHAILDWPVVLHTHCVATIAIAVRRDAKRIISDRLRGQDPVFVPYAKPGIELANAILSRVRPESRVLVLGNHGLVVCGNTVREAEDLLLKVSGMLEPTRENIALSGSIEAFEKILEGSDWCPVTHPATHAIAFDETLLKLAEGATLYPDHLVFLGPGTVVAQPGENPDVAAKRSARDRAAQKLVIVPGKGVAIPLHATRSMIAMANAIGDVLVRVETGAAINRLSETEEDALINWDAEKHRQALNATVTR